MIQRAGLLHSLFSFLRRNNRIREVYTSFYGTKNLFEKEDMTMAILSMIFFGFLAIIAIKLFVRSARIGTKSIDHLFDRIEEKFEK